MVLELFLFYCKLRKTQFPYQRTKACLQYRDLPTCLDAHAQSVSFNRMLFRRYEKPIYLHKYELSQENSV